ncbi:MAG: hypothetical protein UZ03_NOB001002128 [Nitrospira sp. OLB3]|nr:MAG: hypothetical protein UZ03_NOB001002128 [Nitrospira sp. OLB3]RIK59109.1 MAG: hypothetical protein DCC63_08265 [Nitrospira sp.]
MDHSPAQSQVNPVDLLRQEFREHLDLFYNRLKLAAPYHSVEKALNTLAQSLKGLPPAELERLTTDQTLRWIRFRQAFVDSGLHLKHRGIIAGLVRSRQSLNLPPEFDHLLNLYVSPS